MNNNTENTTTSEEGLYPIRTVSEVTGVNAITLRAWERRYGLFKPQRTPKGHRLYSQQDIVRIQQVLELLEKGVAIGRAASALKNDTELKDLSGLATSSHSKELLSASSKQDLSQSKEEPTEDQWKIYHNQLMALINSYDLTKLEQFHREVFSLYPIDILSRSLIRPAIKELNSQAELLKSLAGHYHFYVKFLQQRLGGLFLKSSLENKGKKLLLMSYGDDQSDIELTLFGLPLLTQGYQILLLGCGISFDAIPMMLSRSSSDGIIIYTSSVGDSSEMNLEIVASIKTVADTLNIPVFLTGNISEQQQDEFLNQGIIVLPDNSPDQLKPLSDALNAK